MWKIIQFIYWHEAGSAIMTIGNRTWTWIQHLFESIFYSIFSISRDCDRFKWFFIIHFMQWIDQNSKDCRRRIKGNQHSLHALKSYKSLCSAGRMQASWNAISFRSLDRYDLEWHVSPNLTNNDIEQINFIDGILLIAVTMMNWEKILSLIVVREVRAN